MEQIYDFLTPGEYTYPASIEINAGVVSLANIGTPTTFTENFNDATGLTYGADIEISGGAQAQLVLGNNPGQNFTEDFADDTDFTYNASNSEFTGGLVRQIQKTYQPTYYEGEIYASFDSSMNADYGTGSLTATTVGTPVLNGGKVECFGGGNNGLYWQNTGIAEATKHLTVILKYTPNYSGSPPTSYNIFEINNGTNNNNKILLFHTATGTVRVSGNNNVGGVVWSAFVLGAVWNPTSGTEYEIAFTLDTTTGTVTVYIDGVLYGSNVAGAYTRTGVQRLNIGADGTYPSANAAFNDVILYSGLKITAPYVPFAYGLSAPLNPKFYASYSEDINGDWGDGVLTGVATGGATVSGNKLDLNYSDTRFVEHTAASNADNQQKGCIRFLVTPNYSGTPAATMTFFTTNESAASNNNELVIFHQAGTGELRFNQRNAIGVSEVSFGAVWNPTSGTTYEIEVNYNFTTNKTRMFVGGNLHSSDLATSGTRSSAIGHFVIGTNWQESTVSNFGIEDILVFDHPQHIANYTPDWSNVRPYEYDSDVITLPEMEYTGAGALVSFDSITTTESNAPRYTLQIGRSGNYLYWDGGAWSISDNTYSQANPLATFVANIATLPISGEIYGQFRVYMQGSIGTQQSIDNLSLSLTAQIYPTSNPTIDIDAAITATASGQGVTSWNNFTASVTEGGSDTVTFILSDDNGTSWKYWSGSAWVVSSGFAQSNSASTVDANIGSFPITTNGLKVKIYLHSNNGITTPVIDNLVISYADYIYSVTNPNIFATTALDTEGLTDFAATVTETGSDTITFTVEFDSTEYYWDGAAWSTSTGFAQSNTAAEINTNAASLDLTAGGSMRIISYLHSNDGSTYPTISNITLNYDYYDIPATLPNVCLVTGYLSDVLNNPIVGATVSVRPSRLFTIENTDTTIFRNWTDVTTDANGYFEASVFPSTDAAGDDVTYDFKFASGSDIIYRYNLTVPDQGQVDFGDLT